VTQTLLVRGDFAALAATDYPEIAVGSGDDVIRVIALGLSGRLDEARSRLSRMQQVIRIPSFQWWADFLMAWIERRPAAMLGQSAFGGLKISNDPESIFQGAWLLCDAGEHGKGLEELGRGVANGYFAAHTLATSRSFDALRGESVFQEVLGEAERGRDEAMRAFRTHGGERLFGV
jgi:hypothetical protein